MDGSVLLRDADIALYVLAFFDIRQLARLRQVSRNLLDLIDTSRYLWITALRHMWAEQSIPYPSRVPIEQLSLEEIIHAAQKPYRLSCCLEHHPDHISTSSPTLFTIDIRADIASPYLFHGGRWMLYVNSSGLSLEIADLDSIVDGKPKVYQEPLYDTPLPIWAVCDVQWHRELNCAVVLVILDGPSVVTASVVQIEWSPTSPHVPLFHRRLTFDSGWCAGSKLSGDYCIFSMSNHVIWNWRTNARIDLSLPRFEIETVLSPTQVLGRERGSDHPSGFSVIICPPLNETSDGPNRFLESKLHSFPWNGDYFLKIRNWDPLSRAHYFLHGRYGSNEGGGGHGQICEVITVVSSDSSSTSASWTARSCLFPSKSRLHFWKSDHIILNLPGFRLNYATEMIHYTLFNLDKSWSQVNPPNPVAAGFTSRPLSGLGGSSVGFCGVSGSVVVRLKPYQNSFAIVKLSCDV